MTRQQRHGLLIGLAFVSPWVIGFLVLMLFPLCASLYWSFCDYDVLSSPVWVGTLNYRDMVTDDVFWRSLWNTLAYAAFALPLGLVVSLMIAVLLHQKIMARPMFRTIFYLPSIVPQVAVAMIWLWLFNGKLGLINQGLMAIGIQGPNWLSDAAWTKPTLVFMSLWQVGGSVVIYLAALQDVPAHLYEAADLDGAGPWGKLWNVTVPMISPVIYFNIVMGIIGSLQVFAGPYIIFGADGGPGQSALFYAVYLFQNAFRYLNMGYACAMAWVLFVMIVVLTWLATKLTRRHVHYAGA